MDNDQLLQFQQFQQFLMMNQMNFNVQPYGGYGGYGNYVPQGYQGGFGQPTSYPPPPPEDLHGVHGSIPPPPPTPPPPPPPLPYDEGYGGGKGKGKGKGAGFGGKGGKGGVMWAAEPPQMPPSGLFGNAVAPREQSPPPRNKLKTDDLDEFPVLGGGAKKAGTTNQGLKVVHKPPADHCADHRHNNQQQQHHVVAPPQQIIAAAWKAPPSSIKSKQKVQSAPPVAYFWYSKHLWAQWRKNPAHIQYVERVFNGLVTNAFSHKMLPPMNREKREVVHELGLYYNISVTSLDKEPNRSCYVKRTGGTRTPPQLLSAWAKTAPDPDETAQNKLSATPSSALVFPSVPVSVGCAEFNTMFSSIAGKWLILRRKRRHSGDGPVRTVIAVFFTPKALEAALGCLRQESFRGKYNYKWTFYENYASQDPEGKAEEYSDEEEDAEVEEPSGPPVPLNQWVSKNTGPAERRFQEEKLASQGMTKNTFAGLKTEVK